MIATTGSKWTDEGEEPTREEGTSDGNVYREVSFNDKIQQRGWPARFHISEVRDAGPVCRNGCFGVEALKVPETPTILYWCRHACHIHTSDVESPSGKRIS
jgi:hypothetical protein